MRLEIAEKSKETIVKQARSERFLFGLNEYGGKNRNFSRNLSTENASVLTKCLFEISVFLTCWLVLLLFLH